MALKKKMRPSATKSLLKLALGVSTQYLHQDGKAREFTLGAALLAKGPV